MCGASQGCPVELISFRFAKLVSEARPSGRATWLLALPDGWASDTTHESSRETKPPARDEISKLLLVDKIAKSGFVKNGEIVVNQPQIPLDYSMTKYAPGVAALGQADFERTKALADRFQRHELRVVARLLLAQALLRHPPTNPLGN